MRPNFLITLLTLLIFTSIVKSQNIETVNQEENKFVYSNAIKLFLGDSIFIEANNTGSILSDFVKVNSISDSTKTISLKFSYDKFGSNNASLLKVSNPFLKVLYYKAKIRVVPGKRYSETSIMPVWGGIFGMEMWPNKLESIILYDFQLKEK
jgi:hypothetical protein